MSRTDMSTRSEPVQLSELLVHADWVRGLARSLVADPATAEDLAQETWLEALHRLPGDRRNLRGWLARVVRRRARQGWRSATRRARREGEHAAGGAEHPSAASVVERHETQRLVAELVSELREPYRTTLLLCYYEGLSPAQIAAQLRVPGATVRWRLKQARDELRVRLDESFGGDRRAWCLALAPLGAAHELAAPTASAVLLLLAQGFSIMKLLALVAAAGAITLALWAGLAAIGAAPSPLQLASRPAPATVDFSPLPDSPPPEDPTRAEATSAPRSREALSAGPGPATGDAQAPLPWASLRMRVIDGAGSPLAGALAKTARARSEGARAGADGRIELALRHPPARSEVARVWLLVSHPGHASRTFELELRAGEDKPLGEIELQPGGAISGRVLARSGAPLEGARVQVKDDRPGVRERYAPRELGIACDATGSFWIDGVRVGYVRIEASAEGHRDGLSKPVEVRAGMLSSGLEIELQPLGERDLIEGIVVDPDGEPVPYARLRYEASSLLGRSSGSTTADAGGRFRWVLEERRTARDVWASDPDGRFGGAFVAAVQPGTRELVLRLGAQRELELHVADADGAPVREFVVSVLDADARHAFERARRVSADDGRARVRVPATPFVIAIDAVPYELAEVGPFSGASPPAEVEVRLEALPGVRGRVLAAGAPVSGARVSLVRVARHWIEHDELPVTLDPTGAVAALSDESGAFLLSLREAGAHVLRAEAEGFAAAELGPFDLDPRVGLSSLEVALGQGGAIEGRVLVPLGRSPAGTVVCVNRGDTHPRSVRVDEDGRYRFDRLTPGPWQVLAIERELPSPQSSTSWRDRAPRQVIPADCLVLEGGVARFDLDLRGEADCVLAGRVLFDGAPPGPWNVRLGPAGAQLFDESSGAAIALDAEGRFELSSPSAGRHRLMLSGPSGGALPLLLWTEVELAHGRTPFELDLPTGTVRVENAPGQDPMADKGLFVLSWSRGELSALVPVGAAEPGPLALAPFPAGRVRLARVDLLGEIPEPFDPSRLPVVVELELPPAGEASLRLP